MMYFVLTAALIILHCQTASINPLNIVSEVPFFSGQTDLVFSWFKSYGTVHQSTWLSSTIYERPGTNYHTQIIRDKLTDNGCTWYSPSSLFPHKLLLRDLDEQPSWPTLHRFYLLCVCSSNLSVKLDAFHHQSITPTQADKTKDVSFPWQYLKNSLWYSQHTWPAPLIVWIVMGKNSSNNCQNSIQGNMMSTVARIGFTLSVVLHTIFTVLSWSADLFVSTVCPRGKQKETTQWWW